MQASGETKLIFNTNAAREQLSRLFLRFKQVQDGRIELAWAETSDWKLRHAEGFPVSPEGIEALIARAVEINKGANVYIGATLRNPDTAPFGRSDDDDFYCAVAVWVDLDDDDAVQTAIARLPQFGIRPNMVVTTGTIPAPRVQLWFLLDEPSPDGPAIRKLNEALVAALPGADASVVNVSRVMRLAGSISYPPPKKQERGYVVELTSLAIPVETPYPMDRIERVFAPKQGELPPQPHAATAAPQEKAAQGQGQAEPAQGAPLGLTRVSDLVRQIKAGPLWHEPMIRLVAHLVSTGRSNAEILAWAHELTLPGFTVDQTRREIQQAIDGARRKWLIENLDEAVGEAHAASLAFQTAADFVSAFHPPGYLIDGVIQRGYLYTWTAPTGHGKTAAALYMACMVASGRPFGPYPVERGKVGILAGENPDDVRARMVAACNFYGMTLADLPLWVLPGAYDLSGSLPATLKAIEDIGGLDLLIIDTAAAYSHMDEENSNSQIGDYARILRKLTFAAGKPSVVVPCHPLKNPTRDNLLPRGGGAFVAEVDGNLISWKHDEVLSTFHHQHKIRGPGFEPVEFELRAVDDPALKDAKGRQIPTVVAVPQDEVGVAKHAQAARSDEDRLIAIMLKEGGRPFSAMAAELGWTTGRVNIVPHKSRVARAMERVKADALVKKGRGGSWWLTEKGEVEARKVVMNDIARA